MNESNILINENFAVEEATEFRERLNRLINNGEKEFIINFKNCTFIDSTGLGVLVSIYKRCMELNLKFELHSIDNPNVMKVFKLTRLDKVFTII